MSMNKYIKIPLIIFSALWVMVILALILAIAFIQTGPGQRLVEKTLNNHLVWDEGRVGGSGISGRIPFDFSIDNISLKDNQGQWLGIDQARLRWSFSKLLSRQIHIFELGAGTVDLDRLPDISPKDIDEKTPPALPQELRWKWPLPALTAESIFLDRVRISDQILDEYAELNLASTFLADDQGFSLARLEISRLDKPTSLISLMADLTRDPYYLDLDLLIFDTQILESLIPLENWPSSTALELKGSGLLSTWQGRLYLSGEDVFSADLALEIMEEDSYFINVGGELFVSPALLPAQAFEFTEDPFSFFLKAGLDGSHGIVLEKLAMDSSRLGLEVSGHFDLKEQKTSGMLSLHIADISALLLQSGFQSTDPLNIQATFKGPVDSLNVISKLGAGPVAGHGLSVQQVMLNSNFQLKPSAGTIYSATGDLRVEDLLIQQYPYLPENYGVNFEIDHYAQNILSLKQLNIQARELKANLSGEINFESMQFQAGLLASAGQAQQLIPGLGRDTFFSTDMEIKVKGGGDIGTMNFFADADLSMPGFKSDDTVLNTLAGEKPRITAGLTFDDQMLLQVSQARVKGTEFLFTGSGDMDLRNMEMEYSGLLSVPSLTGLSQALDKDISGEIQIQLDAAGEVTRPRLRALADIKDFVFEQLEPADLQADLETHFVQEGPRGSLEMSITQDEKRLDVYTGFNVTEQIISIFNFYATGHGLDITADIDFSLESRLADGKLLGDIPDLDRLGQFIGLNISGALEWDIILAPQEGKQSIFFSLAGENLGYDDHFISEVEAWGDMDHVSPQGLFHSQIRASGMRFPQTEIALFAAEVQGTRDRVNFSTDVSGEVIHPLELVMQGRYTALENRHTIEVSDLHGNYAHESFHLNAPAVLIHSEDLTSLRQLSMKLGPGTLTAEATMTPEQADVSLKLQDLKLENLPVQQLDQLLGVLHLDLTLSGNPASPRLSADFHVEGLAPSAAHLEISQPMLLTAHFRLEGGQALLEAALMENRNTLVGLEYNMPMEFALVPFTISLSDTVPVQGQLHSELDLETLSMILLPPDQLLTGIVQADVVLSGTLAQPEFQGTLNLNNGSYEHLDGGVFISDLELRAQADQNRITISRISASDGLSGEIKGSGSVDLDPAENMPWNLDFILNNMRIINHKLALAYISSGSLDISGDKSKADLSGRIGFQSVHVGIPDQAPPGIVDLDVIEINRPEDLEETHTRPIKTHYPVSLDLELDFPSRVYVRGRGLDSEWGGNLKITGEASSPSVRGDLSVVRGRLEILDRRFNLSRDSIINLDGTHPLDPHIDIRAELRQRNIVVNVRVFGPALQPEIELTSDPPMPQDEILAWVLFGRDLANITPFQAIALANAARTLAMGQTGPGVLGQVRDFIGVDDLDITGDPEDGETQFGLGKYVHERVYVQVKKGTGSGSDSVSVEVELTPRISLESSLESEKGSGVGIFWKYDY